MEVNNLVDWNGLTPQEQVLHLQQQNNAWSAEQAQKQMDFQREMSNTAHQREIEDLKAAGLNPVLSAKLGGASTPSGAMATGDTSATSARVDMLALSMETANSASLAAAGAVGSGISSGFDFESLMFKNPRTLEQMIWNLGIMTGDRTFGDNGVLNNVFGSMKDNPIYQWIIGKFSGANNSSIQGIKAGVTSGVKAAIQEAKQAVKPYPNHFNPNSHAGKF